MLKIALFFIAGVFTWSFAEYYLHNFVGHLGKGRNVFSREHLAHHANPAYFTPALKKVMAAAAAFPLLFLAVFPFIGMNPALAYTAGFGVFYTIYEIIHRRIHTHPPKGRYGNWARKHHMYHHFAPKKNHGVTSPVWDYVFRTHKTPGKVKLLQKNIMDWLCDENGKIKEKYVSDYEIITGKKQSV